MCFVHFHFKMGSSPERRAIFQHQNFKKCSETVSFLTCWLQNALFATPACNFSTAELQKVLPDTEFFNILTCECAFRHSGVQFFDIRTSKNAPNPTCFVHFDFKMCFSPQRRAIFDFSAEHLPPHPPLQQAYFSTDPTHTNHWKTQHFATPLTFGADVSSFFWLSRYCIFFLLTWLVYSAFQLSILSDVRLLNFLR